MVPRERAGSWICTGSLGEELDLHGTDCQSPEAKGNCLPDLQRAPWLSMDALAPCACAAPGAIARYVVLRDEGEDLDVPCRELEDGALEVHALFLFFSGRGML